MSIGQALACSVVLFIVIGAGRTAAPVGPCAYQCSRAVPVGLDGSLTTLHTVCRCGCSTAEILAFCRARYAACVTARFVTSGPGSLQLRLMPLPDMAVPGHGADHLCRTYTESHRHTRNGSRRKHAAQLAMDGAGGHDNFATCQLPRAEPWTAARHAHEPLT